MPGGLIPDVDSAIVTLPNDRAMVYASLPRPLGMELRRLELDPSCRTVEDLQAALAEHVDDNEGMLLLCQSGDYKFGAYAERMFEVRADREGNRISWIATTARRTTICSVSRMI